MKRGDGIHTTCPHCGERIEGADLELNTTPPDGIVRWYPSLLSREEHKEFSSNTGVEPHG